jgi:uncharacterized protein YpmB
MTKNTTILIAILIVLILVGAFVYYSNMKPKVSSSGNEEAQRPEEQKTVLPQATGDIDEAVDALLQSANDEQTAVGNADDDKKLITSDKQEISDFGQSANENEF